MNNQQQQQQQSVSDKYRLAGNTRYAKIQEGNFKSLNTEHINYCINQYDQALRTAENPSERYKACKNLGLTYEKRILIVDLNVIETNTQELNNYMFCLTMMAKNYDLALKYGKQAIKVEQYNELIDKIKKTFIKHFQILMENKQPTHIFKIIQYLTVCTQLTFYFYASLARFYFNEGFKLFETKAYVKSKGNILESKNIVQTYFIKANKPKMDSETKKEFQDILESTEFYLNRITVNLYLERGLECYSEGIFEHQTIELDSIYMALTYFREAYKVCKLYEHQETSNDVVKPDLEQEAICLAHLGHILYKLKRNVSKSKKTEEHINEKAYEILGSAINLADSLKPKDLSKEKWYIFARDDLEEIKKNELKNEEGLRKEKEKVMKENKEIFDKIAELAPEDHSITKVVNFVKYVLEKHPYKGYVPIQDLEGEIKRNTKQFIRKLSVGYHPDKYPKETQEDIKKYFIFEEISKIINRLYDLYKMERDKPKKENTFERADTSESQSYGSESQRTNSSTDNQR